MIRISLVALLACALSTSADARPRSSKPVLSIKSKQTSPEPPPATMEASVKRSSRGHGITLTLHGNGALCNATWTLRDSVIHGETNVDQPATPSCTIALSVTPWPTGHREVGVQLDEGTVQRLRIP